MVFATRQRTGAQTDFSPPEVGYNVPKLNHIPHLPDPAPPPPPAFLLWYKFECSLKESHFQ